MGSVRGRAGEATATPHTLVLSRLSRGTGRGFGAGRRRVGELVSDLLDQLESRIEEAVSQIAQLRKVNGELREETHRLRKELEELKQETGSARKEAEQWRRDRRAMHSRIVRIEENLATLEGAA